MLKIITLHKIRRFDIGGTWNTPEQIEAFLEYIEKNDIEVIGLSDLAENSFAYFDDERLRLLITFDDGDAGIYEYLLPIVNRFSLPISVFLITGYIGKKQSWDLFGNTRQLNWEEILQLQELGVEFGSHSVSHRDLTRLNQEELEFELEESKRVIEDRLGNCIAITYPFDRVNRRVVECSRRFYKIGFGNKHLPPMSILRERIFRTDNLTSLKIKLSPDDSFALRWERFKSKVINLFSIAAISAR